MSLLSEKKTSNAILLPSETKLTISLAKGLATGAGAAFGAGDSFSLSPNKGFLGAEALGAAALGLADDERVGFFAAGRMKDRYLVLYKKRDGLSSTFKVCLIPAVVSC